MINQTAHPYIINFPTRGVPIISTSQMSDSTVLWFYRCTAFMSSKSNNLTLLLSSRFAKIPLSWKVGREFSVHRTNLAIKYFHLCPPTHTHTHRNIYIYIHINMYAYVYMYVYVYSRYTFLSDFLKIFNKLSGMFIKK